MFICRNYRIVSSSFSFSFSTLIPSQAGCEDEDDEENGDDEKDWRRRRGFVSADRPYFPPWTSP
jgi:hypothetical protein